MKHLFLLLIICLIGISPVIAATGSIDTGNYIYTTAPGSILTWTGNTEGYGIGLGWGNDPTGYGYGYCGANLPPSTAVSGSVQVNGHLTGCSDPPIYAGLAYTSGPNGGKYIPGGATTLPYHVLNSAIPPTAAFLAIPISGVSPLTINFTDESIYTPTSWYWEITNDFDSNVLTNTTQNPTFILSNPGIYTVSLTATNDGGSDTEIKTDYITVSSPATPSTKSMEIIGGMNILYFTVIATFLVIVIYLISLFIENEV